MKARLIMYAEPIIKILALGEKVNIKDLPKQLKLSEEDVCSVLEYLKECGTVEYTETMGKGFSGIIGLKVTSKGAEVALGKRPLLDSQEINLQQMNIHAPVQNIAQVQGNKNIIDQSVDNSQYNILKQLIENDPELDQSKKTKLLDLLDKFNKLKETGENAYELLKTVGGITLKYVPLFFSLLK